VRRLAGSLLELVLACTLLVSCGSSSQPGQVSSPDAGSGGAGGQAPDSATLDTSAPVSGPGVDAGPDTGTVGQDAGAVSMDAAGGEVMSSTNDLCLRACGAAAQLHCPKEPPFAACVSDCQMTLDNPPECRAVLEALLACVAAQPPANWECDTADGTAAVKSGVCEREGLQAIQCIFGS
jgi:hypothetical protein